MTIQCKRTRLHISVYFVGMLALICATHTWQRIGLGLGFAMLHELGHLLAMARTHTHAERIFLTPAGIRIEPSPGLHRSFCQEICIAAAGPCTSFLLAAIFWAGAHCGLAFWAEAAWLNLGLGLFNLMPFRQLDGGRMLYYALCQACQEHTANRIVLASSLLCLCGSAFLATLLWLQQGLAAALSALIAVVYMLTVL